MKAWIVSDWTWEWCALVHADTAGRAKLVSMSNYDCCEYIDMRARHLPGMDNRSFTWADCKAAGFEWFDEGGIPYKPKEFYNDCPCEVCR